MGCFLGESSFYLVLECVLSFSSRSYPFVRKLLTVSVLIYVPTWSYKFEQSATAAYHSVRTCKACLRAGSANHPSGTPGTNLEGMISPSRLDEDSWSFYEHQFGTWAINISPESLYTISPESRPPPCFFVFSLVSLLDRARPF